MADPRRYRFDESVQRHGTVVIGGSPLKLFRLTAAGVGVVDRIAVGDAVDRSVLIDALLDAGAIHPVSVPATRSEADSSYSAADVTIVVPAFGLPDHVPDGAIVVDDGSEPPLGGSTIRLDTNLGPAAARNAGLGLVTTPLVAFVDADVELPTGWLEPLLAHFDDDRVAMVAPRVRTSSATSVIGRYERDHSPLDLGPEPARIRAGTRVSYVPAAAIVCRTDAIRAIGGFDTSLRFGEDVDLVWRLDHAGWVCRYEPTSFVRHAPRADPKSWLRQRIGYGSSAAPLSARHPGALAPIRMSGWSLGAWALGALGRPALGVTLGAGSAVALVKKLPDVPARACLQLAGRGNLSAGDQIADAVRRVWWPLLVPAALRSRCARRVLLASTIAARHPLRLVDDIAYSVGVWRGMLAERTFDPLIPQISSWPGRSLPPPPAADR
jgi:mycofactocin system glycosyltransferase